MTFSAPSSLAAFEVFHGAEVGEGGGFGGLFVHGDGLPVLSPVPSEEALLEPQAAIENGEHGGEGAGRDLTQVVHNVPFLNIIQTTVWGVGLVCAAFARPVNPRKRNYAPNLS